MTLTLRRTLFRNERARSLQCSVRRNASWRSALLALATLLLIGASETVLAQPTTADFLVRHDFVLTPGGTITPQVTGKYFLHSWVRVPPWSCWDYEVIPAVQPLGFDPWGLSFYNPGTQQIINGFPMTPTDVAQVSIPSVGFAQTFTASAQGLCAPVYAEANAQYQVNPFGPGTTVSGFIQTYGLATADMGIQDNFAYSMGMTMIEVRGGDLNNGQISWLPTLRDVVADSVAAGFQLDPILYSVEDLQTGQVVEGSLLSINVDLGQTPTPGYFRWESDFLQIAAGASGRFEIDRTSPFLASPGHLELKFDSVQVTVSNDSGVYSGSLPPVGTPLPLAFLLPSQQLISYDLGNFSGHPIDVRLTLGGSSESIQMNGNPVVAVPDNGAPWRKQLRLAANPNPFNPSTQIEFELRQEGHAKLQIYDTRGRHVRTLVDQILPAGDREAHWDGKDMNGVELPSGVYFLRLVAGDAEGNGRMTLVR